MSEKLERRTVPAPELRVHSEGAPKIVGHAALFNTLSEDLGGFEERIQPGAFKDSLQTDDVRALFNHDANHSRPQPRWHRLAEDERGLSIEIDPPDTQVGRDLMT